MEQIIPGRGPGWNLLTFTYLYDQLNRLIQSTCTGCSQHNQTFTYDADGNIASITRGSTLNDWQYQYAQSNNRLQRIEHAHTSDDIFTFQHDSKGRVTNKHDYINNHYYDFYYDHRNLIKHVAKDGLDYIYKYDDNGLRIFREYNIMGYPQQPEYYLRDHTGRELAIYDFETDRIKQINLFGNGLEGRVDASWEYVCVPSECSPSQCEWTWVRTDSKYYYMKDHLGNIRRTITQSGSLVSARDFYPYGEILREYQDGSPDRYQFTEKERDNETNLDYFGARYYASLIGRWLVPDPLANERPGLSPYVYVSNNPLYFTDPTGRREIPDGLCKIEGFTLEEGDWCTSDRLTNSPRWQQANRHNLTQARGYLEYEGIEQREAFYRWLANEFSVIQPEVYWPAGAAQVNQAFMRGQRLVGYGGLTFTPGNFLPLVSFEAYIYIEQISEIIMKNVWGRLGELYDGDVVLVGQYAEFWDDRTVELEQSNPTVQAKYQKMTGFTRWGIDRALGAGSFGLPKMQGSVGVAADRVAYGKIILDNLRTNPELYQQVLQGLNMR